MLSHSISLQYPKQVSIYSHVQLSSCVLFLHFVRRHARPYLKAIPDCRDLPCIECPVLLRKFSMIVHVDGGEVTNPSGCNSAEVWSPLARHAKTPVLWDSSSGPLAKLNPKKECNPRVHICRLLIHLRPYRPPNGRYALHEALRGPNNPLRLPRVEFTLGMLLYMSKEPVGLRDKMPLSRNVAHR